jgi:hypothetical protein
LDIAAAAQVVSIVSAAGWPTWFYIYSFFAGAFFALAVADLVFDGLAFDCAFLAADFDFWTFVFPPLSLAQRAFAAALIFALAASESLRR